MKTTARIRPGMIPPISKPLMEIPDKLPSNTVRPEGGISMSTAPMAMIGPMARLGW